MTDIIEANKICPLITVYKQVLVSGMLHITFNQIGLVLHGIYQEAENVCMDQCKFTSIQLERSDPQR